MFPDLRTDYELALLALHAVDHAGTPVDLFRRVFAATRRAARIIAATHEASPQQADALLRQVPHASLIHRLGARDADLFGSLSFIDMCPRVWSEDDQSWLVLPEVLRDLLDQVPALLRALEAPATVTPPR